MKWKIYDRMERRTLCKRSNEIMASRLRELLF